MRAGSNDRHAMTTQVLFIQGAGAGAHEADQAMVEALENALGGNFRIHFPRMPGEGNPDKLLWSRAIAEEARGANARILVAHSAGAAITADLVAQGLQRTALPPLDAIFLIAPPYIGRGGWAFDGYHLDRPASQHSEDDPALHLYFGDEDTIVPMAHADLYAKAFPHASVHRFGHCDHQFGGGLADVATDLAAYETG
jgi:predicted alpha/beta hydrolase family esterase